MSNAVVDAVYDAALHISAAWHLAEWVMNEETAKEIATAASVHWPEGRLTGLQLLGFPVMVDEASPRNALGLRKSAASPTTWFPLPQPNAKGDVA